MIDITIVVDVLLTRFDSKYLNTLYVDKKRKQHRLIQAFSRTNRVLNGIKPYGNILDCRQQQDAVAAAIALFSGENCSGRFPAITSPDHLWCGDQRGSPSHTGRLCVRRRPFRTGDGAVTTCADIPAFLRAVTKVVRTVRWAALGQETHLPHRGLCGPLSPTSPAFLRAVTIVVRTVPCAALGQETPLPHRGRCGDPFRRQSRPAPLARLGRQSPDQREVPPAQLPAWNHPAFLLGRRDPPSHSTFSLKFCFLRVTGAFTVSFFHPEQAPSQN